MSSQTSNYPGVVDSWTWPQEQLESYQLKQLNTQLREILPSNRFYQAKLGTCQLQLDSLDQLASLPFTTKRELVDSAIESKGGLSAHHTFSNDQYSRLHRTSGTTGQPLMVMDTEKDWHWWSNTWQHVLQAADVSAKDRVFLAFSFGPFIGFWSAHQACCDRGALVIPAGGLSTEARLEFLKQTEATVVCCTPTYALHLAEVARREDFPLSNLPVRRVIVAGEAGGSLPATRQRIEQDWGADVVDHSGATEIGPWGFGWPNGPGLHVIETSFIAELMPILDMQPSHVGPERASENHDGDHSTGLCELILTSLGRFGAPVIRYRTGDAVRAERPGTGPCRFLWLPGGVLGRTDNMLTIRGVNVFPSSIEAVLREFDSLAEYHVQVFRDGQLDQLRIKAEASQEDCLRMEKRLSVAIGLRIPVLSVPSNSLARSEAKSNRWLDER